MSIVTVKNYDEPSINRGEILRYLGVKESSLETEKLIDECLIEVEKKLSYKVAFRSAEVEIDGDKIDLKFAKTTSKDLAKNLRNSTSVVVFGATVGLEIDRLIAKYGKISPAKAVVFQAIGAERIESLVELFFSELKSDYLKNGYALHSRFSAGYGDLDLSIQKDVFKFLDLPKNIGMTLTNSLIMSPTKSVTAFVGVSKEPCQNDGKSTCQNCDKKDCLYKVK